MTITDLCSPVVVINIKTPKFVFNYYSRISLKGHLTGLLARLDYKLSLNWLLRLTFRFGACPFGKRHDGKCRGKKGKRSSLNHRKPAIVKRCNLSISRMSLSESSITLLPFLILRRLRRLALIHKWSFYAAWIHSGSVVKILQSLQSLEGGSQNKTKHFKMEHYSLEQCMIV